jgi:hypothetical protein
MAAIGVGPAGAATYPDHTIRILVGYAAGGGVDVVARLLSEPMKVAFNQTVIVEDRPGASAMIATNAVAKAAPDGYTLLACASGEVAINQFLFKDKMAYNAAKELAPLALVGIVPCVVVVAATTPVHNPQELIAYAKANPDKLSFSSSGVGNPQQLAGELMNTMAGTHVLHVPLSWFGTGGDRRCHRRGDYELFKSGCGSAAHPGRQVACGRRHIARAHAAVAGCSAVERWISGPERLRTAQLVRHVCNRRNASRNCRAAQWHR